MRRRWRRWRWHQWRLSGVRIGTVLRPIASLLTGRRSCVLRNERYEQLALPMLKSKAASIMHPKDVCNSLQLIGQHLTDVNYGKKLEGTVSRRPVQCLGWSFLALWKLRVGCKTDVVTVLQTGMQQCRKAVAFNLCTAMELRQAIFFRDYIMQHMQPDGAFDWTKINASCTQALITNPISTSSVSISDLGGPAYQPYAYLNRAADAPPKVESCDAFLNKHDCNCDDASPTPKSLQNAKARFLLRMSKTEGTETIPSKVHFVYGLGNSPPEFTFTDHIAVLSALHVHKPYAAASLTLLWQVCQARVEWCTCWVCR